MNVKRFSEAMGELDSKYVDEALNYSAGKKRARRTIRWIRLGTIAACLCGAFIIGEVIQSPVSHVVTESGLLTITAYAASSDKELIMQEGIALPDEYRWSLAMSSRPGVPLELTAAEYPNAAFEVWAEGGTLLLWEADGITLLESPAEIENGTTIYWTCLLQGEKDNMELSGASTAYVNIVIREENHIVGYAVVQISGDGLESEPAQTYYAKLLRSVSFPMVKGEYQKITFDYVASQMEQVQNTAKENDKE